VTWGWRVEAKATECQAKSFQYPKFELPHSTGPYTTKYNHINKLPKEREATYHRLVELAIVDLRGQCRSPGAGSPIERTLRRGQRNLAVR
jgi:hypothetical protein